MTYFRRCDVVNAHMNLCYRDPRNPDNTRFEDDAPYNPEKNCFCDNCFYGRTALANRIIELEEETKP